MFEITEFTQAHVASVSNRVEKHGDEDVPAITIAVEITTANTLLDRIDPSIRHALYKAVDDQPTLEGVETSTPVLRCNSFDTIALTTAHEGWRLFIDDGIDETEPMQFSRVKVDKFRVDAKQGGSIVLKMRMGTSDVDAQRMGKLGMHNGQDIWLQLLPPLPAADAIDGSTTAFERDHPGAAADEGPSLFDEDAADTATDAFLSIQTSTGGDGYPGEDHEDEDQQADELDEVSDAEGLDMHGDPAADELERQSAAAASRRTNGIAARYRNQATGETWSGRGLKPRWLTQALEAGRKLEDFAVAPESDGVQASRRRMRAAAGME
jgi:DNA-binding protein H-NS